MSLVQPFISPPFVIAQDDVLDVELINDLADNARQIRLAMGQGHYIGQLMSGAHREIQVPMAGRMYDLTGDRDVETIEPTWSYGPWADDAGWRGPISYSVPDPPGYRLYLIRCGIAAPDVSDVLKVGLLSWSDRDISTTIENVAEFLDGRVARIMILCYGMRE